MTHVFITVDTELSAGLHKGGATLEENLDISIHGRCGDGEFGLGYQIARLNEHGLKAAFFVDPMPALIYGPEFLKPLVGIIQDGGHEVQLHLHTEWLGFAEKAPVEGRGRCLGEFSRDDQYRLLAVAAELLIGAGAPPPLAFRAGNYGADDRTLLALAKLGIAYDTSFNPAYLGAGCTISLSPDQVEPVAHFGVTELPVSCIFDWPGHLRHAQLCALSRWEMSAALRHAVAAGQRAFTIVSHSFELVDRDRRQPHTQVLKRFDRVCDELALLAPAAKTCGYADYKAGDASGSEPERLGPNLLRTAARAGEEIAARVMRSRGRAAA